MKISRSQVWAWVAITALAIFIFVKTTDSGFTRRVTAEVKLGSTELDLSKLMPREWETVCSSHGYDGPLYLKKYNKTFQPIGDPQDGAWGLIFIQKDGSYVAEKGSRADGFVFDVACMDRAIAKLVLKTKGDVVWIDSVAK